MSRQICDLLGQQSGRHSVFISNNSFELGQNCFDMHSRALGGISCSFNIIVILACEKAAECKA